MLHHRHLASPFLQPTLRFLTGAVFSDMPPERGVSALAAVVDVEEGLEIVELPPDPLVKPITSGNVSVERIPQIFFGKEDQLHERTVDGGRFERLQESCGQPDGEAVALPRFAHPPDLESDVLTRLDRVPKLGLDLQLCLFRSEILVAIDVTAAEPVLGWNLPHPARPLHPDKCVGGISESILNN